MDETVSQTFKPSHNWLYALRSVLTTLRAVLGLRHIRLRRTSPTRFR